MIMCWNFSLSNEISREENCLQVLQTLRDVHTLLCQSVRGSSRSPENLCFFLFIFLHFKQLAAHAVDLINVLTRVKLGVATLKSLKSRNWEGKKKEDASGKWSLMYTVASIYTSLSHGVTCGTAVISYVGISFYFTDNFWKTDGIG